MTARPTPEQHQRRVERARADLESAIDARNAAVAAEHAAGVTIYALAKRLGVTQGAVRKMLGL